MTPPPLPPSPAPWPSRHRGKLALLAGALITALVAVSCATPSNRTIVLPHTTSGATYLGSDACSQCHEQYTKDLPSPPTDASSPPAPTRSMWAANPATAPAAPTSRAAAPPAPSSIPSRDPASCFECHSNLRGQFALPNRHPVMEGRISCSACHDPHKGDAMKGGGTALTSANEVCISCHKQQRGPHVFEHEAMREGCTTCHNPHGSVNQKMLTERNAVLCLKCHFQHQTAPGRIAIGAIDHTALPLPRHMLDRRMPRGRPRLPGQQLPPILTPSPSADETRPPRPPPRPQVAPRAVRPLRPRPPRPARPRPPSSLAPPKRHPPPPRPTAAATAEDQGGAERRRQGGSQSR
jgi:predicted CXXCH cytochrome family protein